MFEIRFDGKFNSLTVTPTNDDVTDHSTSNIRFNGTIDAIAILISRYLITVSSMNAFPLNPWHREIDL